MKRCSKCGVRQHESAFYLNSTSGKPRRQCRVCLVLAARESYDPEKKARYYREVGRARYLASKSA